MFIRCIAFLLPLLLLSLSGFGQTGPKCGMDLVVSHWLAEDPERINQWEAYQEARQKQEYEPSTAKGTAQLRIPVVFQVVLTQAQYNSIGGEAGLRRRMASQIDALNRDFNAQNSDKSKVPAVFSSVFGNPEILFAPAHRDPQGNATDGYVLEITNIPGFTIETSSERRAAYGGLDPWDQSRYLNIWIVNISNSGVLGYALRPDLAAILHVPMGVTVSYMAFGQKRAFMDGPYFSSTDSGRTMVHEMGHFFNLNHIWGNTEIGNGNCIDDDGVHDTPLQKDANYSCQIFPKPNCTNSPGGEMFMNYMDYVNDACMYMFTKGQAARMRAQLSPQGPSYSLTQHPELFSYPQSLAELQPDLPLRLYPNPGMGEVQLEGDPSWSETPLVWTLYNLLGQQVKAESTRWGAQGTYRLPLQGLPAGIYQLRVQTADRVQTLRLELL